MKATYLYQQYNFQTNKTETVKVPVEIVKETDKSYRVKLLQSNVNGHMWGDEIWVQKKSIVGVPQPRKEYDYSDAWWQN